MTNNTVKFSCGCVGTCTTQKTKQNDVEIVTFADIELCEKHSFISPVDDELHTYENSFSEHSLETYLKTLKNFHGIKGIPEIISMSV
jgi:hypothetical protein